MEKLKLKQRCADPLKLHEGAVRNKDLRIVTDDITVYLPSIKLTKHHRLCKTCRNKLDKMVENQKDKDRSTSEQESASSLSESGMEVESIEPDPDYSSQELELDQINKSFQAIGESPVKIDKVVKRHKYTEKKLAKFTKSITEKLTDMRTTSSDLSFPSTSKEESLDEKNYHEIIDQLKDRFKNVSKRSEKIKILTVLPKSWSARKISMEFNTSRHMASTAKKLVEEKGILSDPNQRPGKVLEESTVQKVIDFYISEEVSRTMPGAKDYVSVVVNGQRTLERKHLVLCNLKEAHEFFKERNPNVKVGFSKFAELRPKQCILAGSAGTHSVCVCTIHQNIKLMHTGAKFSKLLEDFQQITIKHPRDWLNLIMCTPSNPDCHLKRCNNCGDKTKVKDIMQNLFDEKQIDSIEFKKWTTTDRSTMETLNLSIDDFIESFCSKLDIYQKHDFIAKMQSIAYRETKENLKPGELLVVLDFAENYSMVLQDEVQSFHWNNEMATVHPFVIYYLDEVKAKIAHQSFVIISDCNIHDTVAVYIFQKYLINFIKKNLMIPSKIKYFSDGCAAQYKNHKNFTNLCHHAKDFGVDAEWNFFATSHGKGPSDGVGGTVKRLARKASLQRPYEQQILTPFSLYQFAKENITGIQCQFVKLTEYHKEKEILERRFLASKTIAGTRGLHFFKPLTLDSLEVKEYTTSPHSRIESLTKNAERSCTIDKITGQIIVAYNGLWWLAVVLKSFPVENEVEVSFLHPHGPAPSFYYPRHPDILIISDYDVLANVDPMLTSKSGRTYKLSNADIKKAERGLSKHLI